MPIGRGSQRGVFLGIQLRFHTRGSSAPNILGPYLRSYGLP